MCLGHASILGKSHCPLLHADRATEALLLKPFLDSALTLLPLTDFNLYPFPVINCDHEYNSCQWVPWILLANYQNSGCFRRILWTCNWCQKWGHPMGTFFPLTIQLSNPCSHMSAPCHHIKRKILRVLAAHSPSSACLLWLLLSSDIGAVGPFTLPASVCSPLSFLFFFDLEHFTIYTIISLKLRFFLYCLLSHQ